MPVLDDLKAHLSIPDSGSDGELYEFLTTATEMVRDWSSESPAGSYTERVRVSGGVAILSRYPVSAVTAVSTAYGSTLTPVANLTPYYLDNAASGLLRTPYTSGVLSVTYTAGNPESARFRMAVLEVAAHLWRGRKGGSDSYLPAGEPDVSGPVLMGGVKKRALLILGDLAKVQWGGA